jgi:hypothetical protein
MAEANTRFVSEAFFSYLQLSCRAQEARRTKVALCFAFKVVRLLFYITISNFQSFSGYSRDKNIEKVGRRDDE